MWLSAVFFVEQGLDLRRFLGNVCADEHGFACLPAVLFHVIGNGGGNIGHAAPNVALEVAVKIHGVLAKAGRHKLRHAHRAGEAACEAERVAVFLTDELQKFA